MIAIDMPMPKGCEECKYKGAKWCYIEIWSNRGAKEVPEEGRPSWCPLIDLTQYEDDLKQSTMCGNGTIEKRNSWRYARKETAAMMERK